MLQSIGVTEIGDLYWIYLQLFQLAYMSNGKRNAISRLQAVYIVGWTPGDGDGDIVGLSPLAKNLCEEASQHPK